MTYHTVIGTEELDQDYGFAYIRSLCFGHDGSVLVVDMRLASVRRYSQSGEYIMSYGTKGEGPGELTEPVDAAVDGAGNVYVSDARGLNRFTFESGEWVELDTRFVSPMLQKMHGNKDSSFTALNGGFDYSTGSPVRVVNYSLYSVPAYERTTTYCIDSREMDVYDSGYFRACLHLPIIAVDDGGSIYIAESTNDSYCIRKVSNSGDLLMEIRGEAVPVELTEEEKQFEIEFHEQRLRDLGVHHDYAPEDYWPAVTDLGVDQYGMIWARCGGSDPPLFRIYDANGDLNRFVLVTGLPSASQFIHFEISPWGMAAYSSDPYDEYEQVYLFDMVSWESVRDPNISESSDPH